MVLKGVNWVWEKQTMVKGKLHSDKRSNGLERSQLGTQWQKSGHMVLKGVNCVHNGKIRSYGLERSQLGTQCKNQVIWSWKESTRKHYDTMRWMVLKRVNRIHNDKMVKWSWKESIGYTMQKSGHVDLKSQLGTQCKIQVICLERSQLGTQW